MRHMGEAVLITGANGFIGSCLRQALHERKISVRSAIRHDNNSVSGVTVVPYIDGRTDWSEALLGVHSVIHLAARVHVMNERAEDPLGDFRGVNTDGTANLAEQAAEAGVRRFVYLSSIKVNGEHTIGQPFSETDIPAPRDPYAISKWEAEQRIHEISGRTGMEVVVIRPPLVYGPGVKGNILRLLHWIDKGVPLPFGNVENHRSLVGLTNLVDFMCQCLEHPKAAGETFLISDGQDLSTRDLIRGLAAGMGKHSRLWPVPNGLVKHLSTTFGKETLWRRLWGDLQVDISKARELLEWNPAIPVEVGLAQVGAWYRDASDMVRD